jgi:hypothetical protein
MYRVLRKNSSVHSAAVAWFCDELVLNSSASMTTSPFFIIPEREQVDSFYAVTIVRDGARFKYKLIRVMVYLQPAKINNNQ